MAERDRGLDEKRALADVLPRQGERLAGSQAGVGEHRDQRCVTEPPVSQDHCTDRLDHGRRQRSDGAAPAGLRLAHAGRRVGRNPAPLDRASQDPVQQRQRLGDRDPADAVGLQIQTEPAHGLGSDVAQLRGAQARQDVRVQQPRVQLEGLRREVGVGVQLPPFACERGQRLLAGVQASELARALHAPDFGVECLRVALAPEDLGAVAALLVAPAHAPDDVAGLALNAFHAHEEPRGTLSRSSARKWPVAGIKGGPASLAGVLVPPGSTAFARSHASNASGVMRRREHSRTAGSSPRRIAS
ncbi:MAG TPA: hypothetical protein VII98_01160 [Solirubrobacteraceae bacterium]